MSSSMLVIRTEREATGVSRKRQLRSKEQIGNEVEVEVTYRQ